MLGPSQQTFRMCGPPRQHTANHRKIVKAKAYINDVILCRKHVTVSGNCNPPCALEQGGGVCGRVAASRSEAFRSVTLMQKLVQAAQSTPEVPLQTAEVEESDNLYVKGLPGCHGMRMLIAFNSESQSGGSSMFKPKK